jgi:hypothetical protein
VKCRYVAIDCETTSLDPEREQVLELALVAEVDWQTPVELLPSLHLLVEHDELRGDPVALAMNARLIAELAKPLGQRSLRSVLHYWVGQEVARFFNEHMPCPRDRPRNVTVAGKNCSTFDLPFLSRLPGWPAERVRHRVLDVGCLWFDPATDEKIPDSAECFRRAGLEGPPPHAALEDARAVVQMVRRWYAKRG